MFSFIISQTRYKDEIFSEVIKTEDVVYGNAPDIPFNFAFEWFTEDIDLTMDIYEADGDTLTNRPVIITPSNIAPNEDNAASNPPICKIIK